MTTLRNVGLCLLLTAVAASAAVDPGLLGLVMPDAKVISGMQVGQARSSAFGQYLLSQMQGTTNDAGFQKFIAATGFDPRRDLQEIVAATNAAQKAGKVLVLGRGNFNPAQILAAAKAHGGTVTNYKGVDIVSAPSKDSTGAVAFLDPTTAAMGDLNSVQGAIDRKQSGSTPSGDLAAKAKDISASNDAWFVTLAPISDLAAGHVPDPNVNSALQGNLLQAIVQTSGGLHFGNTSVQINGEAVTRSDKDATALQDVVRFLAGLVQTNSANNPQAGQVATLLNSMQLSTQANVMKMTLIVPEDQLEKLVAPGAVPHLAPRARKPGVVR